MIGQLMDAIGEWTRAVMEVMGYPGLVLITIVENVFPPIPSEIVLPLAGFLAHEGEAGFTLPLVILAGGLGSVLGALVLYAFGAWARAHGGRRVVLAVGRYAFLTEKDLDLAETWFGRYQAWAVFICRFVPVVRSIVSIPAGYNRMPVVQFLVLTAVGTTLWCAILAGSGWILAENWPLVRTTVSQYERLVIVVAGLLIVGFLAWRFRQRLTARPEPDQPGA
jgi:membrane protein DedA with SNARE-associated domain